TRYLCIIVLMLYKLHPDPGMQRLAERRSDLQNANDLDFELQIELMNAVIFADSVVIAALAGFIRDPSRASFVATAVAMRRDLWGRRRASSQELRTILNSSS